MKWKVNETLLLNLWWMGDLSKLYPSSFLMITMSFMDGEKFNELVFSPHVDHTFIDNTKLYVMPWVQW